MTDQKEGDLRNLRAPRQGASWLDHAGRERLADGLAAAVAASLPWSTTATGILLVAWLVTLVSVIDPAGVRREIMSPAGGLPIVLVAIAALGMAWSQATLGARLQSLEGFCKLLLIPLLLAQFRRSERGWLVVLWFLGASVALLVASSALASIPGLPWRGKMPGVPVKDYISQSGIFAFCAFALLGCASETWRHRRQLACVLIVVAAAFIANIAYVETGRTTLVIMAVLVPVLGFRQFGWRGSVVAVAGGCAVAGLLWISSDHLRARVTHVFEEVQLYETEHVATSSGVRLDYWKKSIGLLSSSPIAGYGTGSIPMLLTPAAPPSTNAADFATVDPHNQILLVALQLGLIGTVVLLAMWIAHLALFRGGGLISWIGLVAVVQNMVSSLFNSHLSDFTQGWLYVFAVGVLGGTALRQAEPQPAESASRDDATIEVT